MDNIRNQRTKISNLKITSGKTNTSAVLSFDFINLLYQISLLETALPAPLHRPVQPESEFFRVGLRPCCGRDSTYVSVGLYHR